jgi:hypothetical protein
MRGLDWQQVNRLIQLPSHSVGSTEVHHLILVKSSINTLSAHVLVVEVTEGKKLELLPCHHTQKILVVVIAFVILAPQWMLCYGSIITESS